MTNTNITNLRKNLFEYIDQAITYNDVINVNTKKGNAVIMSEEDKAIRRQRQMCIRDSCISRRFPD